MAAHAERPDEGVEQASPSHGAAQARATVVGSLATLVRWIGLVFAIVLVAHVLLTVGNANPDNGITVFFARVADPLALAFRSLFTPDNAELRVLVNYGLAAIFWLVVSSVLAKLLRRLA